MMACKKNKLILNVGLFILVFKNYDTVTLMYICYVFI